MVLTVYEKQLLVVNCFFDLPSQPVKNWMAYILSLYILFSALVPCSIFDKCEASACTEQGSDTDQHNDCNSCSPFSICSSVSGVIISTTTSLIQPPEFLYSPTYGEYHFSSNGDYHSSLFQPPRLA
jgi:hypothetical protein